MNRLVALHVGGALTPWQAIGLTFDASTCPLADVDLIVSGESLGLHSWTIDVGRDETIEIDGIRTNLISGTSASRTSSVIGTQRVIGLDHVVVNTDDIDRTTSAITAALGLEVRRERQLGNGAVQRFHKLDNTIIEVVSGPHVKEAGASLWGMVASIDDLFDLADGLGEDITSPPKKATQPGRYISTVRGSVGLGVPFALMTPHVRTDND
jgi:hypothetical protein